MFFGMLLDALSSLGFLAGHISSNAFPRPLKPEEEALLIEKMEQGDEQAKNKLVECNLRLVAHIAGKYQVPGMTRDDLISVGAIGLIKAISTYKREKNAQLSTYSARCIENEIRMLIRSGKKHREEIPLSEPVGKDGKREEILLSDVLGTDPDLVFDSVNLNLDQERLKACIDRVLTKRERQVVLLRYGLMGHRVYPQREVALLLNISRSYVSRIEKKALQKLKSALED